MSQPEVRTCVGPAEAPDRYELAERRAAGGEGEVWRAVEYHGGAPFAYAVKIIEVDGGRTDRSLEELRLQAALATHLEHPAVVKVKEVFVGALPHPSGTVADAGQGQRLYFVMKWIEGDSLQEALESGRIRGLDVLAPLEPIAEAIDHLHSGRDTNGTPVLHRDIKPANVLLADDGRVYLVDLGLVRFQHAAATSRIFGTAPFMAPESLARGEYTPATDRYTLGATVYYALTAEMPVVGDFEGMGARLTAALGPGQDRVVRGVLAMLAVQADARPASAAAWLRALRTAPPETTLGAPAGSPVVPPTEAGRPRSPQPGAPAGYPAPPGSPAPGYPMPPGSIPPSGFLGPPSGYPMPPGSIPPGPPSGPVTGPPAGYPMGPGLGMAAAGYLSGPPVPKKKSTGKIVAWVAGGLAVALAALCCLSSVSSMLGKGGSGLGGLAKETHAPVDRSVPPPPVTALEPVLVSVGDILAATKASEDAITKGGDTRALNGGLTQLKMCAEPAVDGDAIGAHTSNTFIVSMSGYPYIASAVAGFYGTAATTFLTAARTSSERCGWKPFSVPKLGQEAFGVYFTEGSGYSERSQAAVFVRSGQVVFMVTATSSGGYGAYQSDTVELATAMAARLPKA
ncbi:serine/threonine-protein kinase [Longispora sp. K20-0274]|uniref:protein kinase domain-containing protein n=1 Tax=Longispora sp. K20-0274 TaxID=3088255 RepID=UPI00399B1520